MKFYVEIYTRCPETNEGGYEIEILEILARDEGQAREKAKKYPLFDCIITSGPIFD